MKFSPFTIGVVLLGVFAVLGGLLMNAPTVSGSKLKHIQTFNDASGILQALRNFEAEYHRLPNVGALDLTTDSREGRKLLAILLGKEAVGSGMENPRQITFLGSPKVNKTKAKGGLVYSNGGSGATPEGLYDAWGEPYEVFLRVGGEDALTFHDGKAIVQLPGTAAAVLSKGPDKIKGTDDDIQKW